MRLQVIIFSLICCCALSVIDRNKVVARHNVHQSLPLDPTAVTSLGNGAFAYNVDITGLQSLNCSYSSPFDLNTLADWGWHTSFEGADALGAYNFTTYSTETPSGTRRSIRYPTGSNASSASGAWLHNNPHRLPLSQVSLAWAAPGGGELLILSDVISASQGLDAWEGAATSVTTVRGATLLNRTATDVRVLTAVHPNVDALAVSVELVPHAALHQQQQQQQTVVPLVIRIAFPYTTGGAADWSPSHDSQHTTTLVASSAGHFVVERTVDGDSYRVDCNYNMTWAMERGTSPHVLVLLPPSSSSTASTDLVCLFAPHTYPVGAATLWLQQKRAQTLALQQQVTPFPSYSDVAATAASAWKAYWLEGAFVDLIGVSSHPSPEAFELERRVIRSLYLLRALEAGAEPPAETGLLLGGGWGGKHHGEMRYWHQAWAAFWGRSEILERSDAWYEDFLLNATSVAASQGYVGARWPKMIAVVSNRSAGGADVPWVGLLYAPLPEEVHNGTVEGLAPLLAWESSSGVGPLLVWQQGHSILLAEAQRRAAAAIGGAAAASLVMERLGPIVFASADFMASFVTLDQEEGIYHLLPPLYGGEEEGNPQNISDPAFELVQFNNALDTASAWREAMHLPPIPAWERVRGHLAAPPLDPATGKDPGLFANNAACACLYNNDSHSPCNFPRLGCPTSLTSHPMTSGLVGMLNGLAGDSGHTYGLTVASANATASVILNSWKWGGPTSSPDVWGWDAPLLALSLVRLNWTSSSVIAALMLPFNKNLYNAQGVNQGMGSDTAYFPGNGGTLLAVAAIAAGFDTGAPGAQLRGSGPGAIASNPSVPLGFPVEWNAVVEDFIVPLP